jgi:RNA polymerase sigma factor (sigma-70 family)
MGAIAASKPVLPLRVLPLRTLSDERLAELASAGHSDAFGTLYERYRDALSRYCRSIVRDTEDAGDALQNTMVSVLRALHGRGPSGPVRPWLYRIAHNESVSILRRRHPQEELSPETPDRADTEYASFARFRFDALLADLMALPERQRGALVMRELGGLEYSEIGDALEMSAVSARKHVFEARVALHDIAAGRDAECGDIVRRISDGDGRVLRARSVRGHLRGCTSCSDFARGLSARRGTFALIPPLPFVATGALLTAALHGGGATTTSGLAAGGSVAGGSIAAGSLAAAGSLLGGGSFAAIKGLIAAGAIAVAGAGVIVGTGISSHAGDADHSAAVVAHAARVTRVRAAVATVPAAPAVAKPLHLAVVHTSAVRAPSAASVTGLVRTTPRSPRYVPPAVSVPRTQASPVSGPNQQAPAAAVPVAVTSPTTTPTSPAPTAAAPTAPAPTPATGYPATGYPSAGYPTPATATNLWIEALIASVLKNVGANMAAAQAQVQQQAARAGASPSITQMIESMLSTMFSGAHP